MIKIINKLGIDRNYLNIKARYEKAAANITPNGERPDFFSSPNQELSKDDTFTTLFNMVLKFLAIAISLSKKKINERHPNGKEVNIYLFAYGMIL